MKTIKDIKKSIRNLKVQSSDQIHSRVLDKLLTSLDKSKNRTAVNRPDIWRTIMKSKLTKLAVAAVIIIAALVGINPFGGLIDPATPALAKVLEQIYEAKSVIFNQTYYTSKTEPFTVKRMLVEPGIMRTEFTKNEKITGITIYDCNSGKQLQYHPSQKTAYLKQKVGRPYVKKMLNYLDWISKLHVREGRFIGQEKLNSQLTNVFVIEYDYETITVWADPVTNLPICVEEVQTPNPDENIIVPYMALSESDFGGSSNTVRSVSIASDRGDHRGIQENKKIVMSDFQWNVELDQSLFSLVPPEGYTVEKMQFDASDPSEKALIEALAFWTEMSDGLFPSDINLFGDPNQIKPMLIKKYDSHGDPKQEFTLAFEKMNRILQGLMFAQQLKADRNWHYTGTGVKLGDSEKPVCWYRLEDTQKYRVIYGDLSVKNVDIADLPK